MKDMYLDTLDPSGSLDVEGAEVAAASPSSVRVTSHGGHAAGDILAGKYQIIGFLGEGGMGTVWRAHSLVLDIAVAIKVLHREHADGDAAARLRREAQTMASLGHPAIVRVFDFGETDTGEPFLVMELLDGISLADWIDENGRMPAAEAARTLLPIVDALMAAHAHGIVHRDVKPDNILLVPDGVGTYAPKILDFGVAKLLTARSGRVITQAGTVVGSLEYMSPEQAEGRDEVGEQTDVWGLSVVLYELITGHRPFIGSTLTEILLSVLTRRPTPTIQLAAGDEELWEVIARGLEKSLAERWPDMHAFGAALASWAIERGVTTDATGTSLTHHWLATPSQPPEGREAVAPISAPPPPRTEPRGPARLGTLETTCVGGVTPPRRQARAIFTAVLATLLAAPVVVAAGMYAHRRDGSPGSFDPVPMTGAEAPAMVPDASAATLPDAAPEPAPTVSAAEAASEATPQTRLPPRRAPLASRPRAPSTAMPLPPGPNF